MTLDELKRICAEATPGPWHHGQLSLDWSHEVLAVPPGQFTDFAQGIATAWGSNPAHVQNAALIAAARTYLPRLIAVAEAAEDLKCHTPETTPDGDVPCFGCAACCVHRALAALEGE